MMWPRGQETQKTIHLVCNHSRIQNAPNGRFWLSFWSATTPAELPFLFLSLQNPRWEDDFAEDLIDRNSL